MNKGVRVFASGPVNVNPVLTSTYEAKKTLGTCQIRAVCSMCRVTIHDKMGS
jgi:hypothetical protein